MRLRPTVAPTVALAAAALLSCLSLALFGASAAGAHEGAGVVDIEAAHPAGTGTHYIVRVTWEDDGHPAADATVTATPVDPGGSERTPVELPPYDDDGRYAAVVETPEPGTWTVRFTSIEPTGTAETTAEVEAAPAEEGGSEDTTGQEPGGFAPADDGTGGSADQSSGDDTGDLAADETEQDGGLPVLLVIAAAVVAVGGVVAALRVARRYQPDGDQAPAAPAADGDGDPAGTEEAPAAPASQGGPGPDPADDTGDRKP